MSETYERSTVWRNEPAINTPITAGYVNVVDVHAKPSQGDIAIKDGKACMYRGDDWTPMVDKEKPREVKAVYMGIGGKAVKIFDRNWAKSELKPQICTCCLAPLPADSNTCEYCGTTYR